jgi:hypothetical protein
MEYSSMKFEPFAPCEGDTFLENLALELTEAAYGVALRHRAGEKGPNLQMDLWGALTHTLEKRYCSDSMSPAPSETGARSAYDS